MSFHCGQVDMMRCFEERRDAPGRFDLRHRGHVAGDGVGVKFTGDMPARMRDDRRRIDAAGEKDSDWHIRDQMRRDAVTDRLGRPNA